MRLILVFAFSFGLAGCGETGVFTSDGDACDGYGDPAESKYVLPYPIGRDIIVAQGNCTTSSHFGVTRFSYDFDLKIGDIITAARGGKVVTIKTPHDDSNQVLGNYLVIEHEDGTFGFYIHLTKDGELIEKGAMVSQGQEIAISGKSGANFEHLHFMVKEKELGGFSRPITFRNAENNKNGLQETKSYVALDYTPDGS